MDPVSIAACLRELAAYLKLEKDPHRAKAYARAAATIEAIHDLEERVAAGTLRELPGIGASTEAIITALHHGQEVEVLTRMRERWPPALDHRGRLVGDARRLGGSFVDYLALAPEALEVHAAGPARRWLEVVDALVIVVVTRTPAAIGAHLARFPLVRAITEDGAGRFVAQLADGGRCEVHCAAPDRLGAALIVATGSAAHVAQLRARGRDLDAIAGGEQEVYAALGLPWLPPEVRDGDDELVRAAAGERFDDLLTVADVTGAVHCHTTYSDGRNSIAEMAAAAAARGLGFLTITDHSGSAGYAHGLEEARLRGQWSEIAEVQAIAGVRLLRGVESDILADGNLDYPLATLGELDVVIASVHQRYKLDEDGMTRRLVAAMRQPIFKIWGHALGRLLLSRDPVACRFDEVLDAIVESRAAIEINGDPKRLDLDPARVRVAHARGVRFVVSSDAHATGQLDYLENAVAMARRARLRPADVLNTLPTAEFIAAVRPA